MLLHFRLAPRFQSCLRRNRWSFYSHLSGAIEFLPYGVTIDEFQHFVYENPEATPEERKKKYHEIVEKLEEPEETNRREVKYAEVKNDKILNTLYIDSTYKENLPLVITLSDYDVEKFSLVEGDIIDYRYWDPNVLQGKVVWRYEIDSEEEGLSLDEDGEI